MDKDLTGIFTFDDDGDGNLRVTPIDTGAAYLVLGWSSEPKPGAADGKLPVDTGSGSYPSDSELTLYRLEAIGRWKPDQPPGIRCRPGFDDCPIPPPPTPLGPIPPKPKDEQIVAILRGAAFRD